MWLYDWTYLLFMETLPYSECPAIQPGAGGAQPVAQPWMSPARLPASGGKQIFPVNTGHPLGDTMFDGVPRGGANQNPLICVFYEYSGTAVCDNPNNSCSAWAPQIRPCHAWTRTLCIWGQAQEPAGPQSPPNPAVSLP